MSDRDPEIGFVLHNRFSYRPLTTASILLFGYHTSAGTFLSNEIRDGGL